MYAMSPEVKLLNVKGVVSKRLPVMGFWREVRPTKPKRGRVDAHLEDDGIQPITAAYVEPSGGLVHTHAIALIVREEGLQRRAIRRQSDVSRDGSLSIAGWQVDDGEAGGQQQPEDCFQCHGCSMCLSDAGWTTLVRIVYRSEHMMVLG